MSGDKRSRCRHGAQGNETNSADEGDIHFSHERAEPEANRRHEHRPVDAKAFQQLGHHLSLAQPLPHPPNSSGPPVSTQASMTGAECWSPAIGLSGPMRQWSRISCATSGDTTSCRHIEGRECLPQAHDFGDGPVYTLLRQFDFAASEKGRAECVAKGGETCTLTSVVNAGQRPESDGRTDIENREQAPSLTLVGILCRPRTHHLQRGSFHHDESHQIQQTEFE